MNDLLTYTPQEFASIVSQIHKIERDRVLDALVSNEVIRTATDRYLDTAFFTEMGQNDIAYVPLGDVERSIGLALTAAANHLRVRV